MEPQSCGNLTFIFAPAKMSGVTQGFFVMIKTVLSAGALALLSLSAPAMADPSGSQPTPETKTQDDGQTNKVVCRRVEAIGTRLSSKKVCRTQAQWDAEAAANRQDLERSQTQRWKSD
ncbi:MAG TPA: hypothetical protein PKN09_02045 [Novosphingobium sp.]|nr:hypothetical protein [Novosphingobium sp.]